MSLFFVADNKVLDDARLSSNDKVIYLKLVSYMNRHTGSCFPRHATISKAIGLSRSTIYRSILHLAKLGYVKINRKSSTNEYHLPKQVILENTRKKLIVDNYVSNKSNYVSSLTDINKTKYNYYRGKNNYRNSYNRKSFSSTGVANHSKRIFEHKGEKYKNDGEWGDYLEFRRESGKRIKVHKFKNLVEEITPKKKTETAAIILMQRETKAS
jgi:predicted transcriptional regulator